MRYLASDVETVGLYDKVHNKSDVHCLCSIDCDTDEVYLFHDHPEFDEAKVWDEYDEQEFTIPKRTGTLEEGIKFWEEASASGDKLVIHNTHTFDRLIVDKLWPSNSIDFEAYHDTYIQSKVQWYERPTPKGSKGAHGLKAYGIRCGVNKPEITDWVQLDAYKMHRVVQDCRIQAETFKLLEKERKGLLDKYGIDFTIALKIESHYAADVAQQELDGAKVDIPYINTLIVDLDNKLEKLTEEIEPELPPTVKGKGVKLSRKEVAEALGRNPEKTKDKYIQKKVNGEVTTVVEKPYFKPCTSYTKVIKSNLYSGFHITVGESPSFNKKKDLTDWIKATTNTKTNEWDIEKSEVEREVLNKNTCDYFGIEEDSDLIVGPFTKVDINPSKMTQNDVVKKFLIRLGWKHAEEWNLKKNPYGAYVKAEENTTIVWPLNAAPENQMKRFVKKGDYILTTPKLSEDEYSQLPEGIGKKIAEYNTYQHRRRFLSNPKDPENKGLLSFVREDGRIPCGVNNFGTRSGRGAQRAWVNAPSSSALYGNEIRKCIIAEEGKELVAVDMKSAQLSIAAYYANNIDYYGNVATGLEFTEAGLYVGETAHCVNARMFGMVTEEQWREAVKTQNNDLIELISLIRKNSKGGSFACLPVENTKILTKGGWYSHGQLKEGMEVMTYNKSKGANEWKPIQKIHFFKDKEVIRMENNEWCMDSTEDHRWIGKRRTGRGVTKREVEEFITTKDIKSEFKIYNAAPCETPKESLLTLEEAAVLGWVFSDGCVSWKPYSTKTSSRKGEKRGVKVVITQADHKYGQVIEDLLKTEGCFTGKSYKRGSVNPCANYNINSSYFRKLWEKSGFGQSRKHEVDLTKLMLSLGKQELTAFIDAFFLADGHTDDKNGKHISQNRGNIYDGVRTGLYLLGINTSVSSKGVYLPSGKECVDIRFRKKTYTGSTNLRKTSLGVADTFCITTENDTFVCMQGDIITITGNCLFGASGRKVAVTIGIPEQEGNKRKEQFLTQLGLTETNKQLQVFEGMYKRSGGFYLPLAHGYWLWNNSSHKSLNTIVQGFEALAQKLCCIKFRKECRTKGWEGKVKKILDVHDEVLLECDVDVSDEAGKLLGRCYTWAAKQIFNWHVKHPDHFANPKPPLFPIDLNGGFKKGNNYYEVH